MSETAKRSGRMQNFGANAVLVGVGLILGALVIGTGIVNNREIQQQREELKELHSLIDQMESSLSRDVAASTAILTTETDELGTSLFLLTDQISSIDWILDRIESDLDHVDYLATESRDYAAWATDLAEEIIDILEGN